MNLYLTSEEYPGVCLIQFHWDESFSSSLVSRGRQAKLEAEGLQPGISL